MKKIMSLLILAAATVACTDDDIRTEQDFTNGPKIVGFAKSVENVAYFENVGAQTQNVQISLIGTNGEYPSDPFEVTYEVDTENSTASEGVEFDFTDDTRKITFPAGASFVNLPIIVNTGQLNPTDKTELYLKLTSASGAAVGAQYNTLKVVFVGCTTALEGPYLSGATPVTVTKISPNTYRCDRLPGISVNGAKAWFEFSDVCSDLEILTWQYDGSYPITGPDGDPATGFVQPNGNLTFEEVSLVGVSFYTNRTFTLVRQ